MREDYDLGYNNGFENGQNEGRNEGYTEGWNEAEAYFTRRPIEEVTERNRQQADSEDPQTGQTSRQGSSQLENIEARTDSRTKEKLDAARARQARIWYQGKYIGD